MSEDLEKPSPSENKAVADGNALAIKDGEAKGVDSGSTVQKTIVTETVVKEEETEVNPTPVKMGDLTPEAPSDSLVHKVTATSTVTEVIPADPTQPPTVAAVETKVVDEVAPMETTNGGEETMELTELVKEQPVRQSISKFSMSDNMGTEDMEVDSNSEKVPASDVPDNDNDPENERMTDRSDSATRSEGSKNSEQKEESSEEDRKSDAEAGKENSQGSTQPLSAERDEPIVYVSEFRRVLLTKYSS
mgnify:CR=1 FL=1